MIDPHLRKVVEVSKEPNPSVEQVQKTCKDIYFDDGQKAESDDKKTEISNEVNKKEIDLDLKAREEILPKKNKKHKTKERMKKKGKSEAEEKHEDKVKDIVQAVNTPEKENDTSSIMRCNPPTTPYLER